MQYLARVDRIVVLADGEIKFSGTYAELQRAQQDAQGSGTLQEVLSTILKADQEETAKKSEEEDEDAIGGTPGVCGCACHGAKSLRGFSPRNHSQSHLMVFWRLRRMSVPWSNAAVATRRASNYSRIIYGTWYFGDPLKNVFSGFHYRVHRGRVRGRGCWRRNRPS